MTKEIIRQTRLDAKTDKKLEKELEKEGMNASSWIRRLITRHLESHIRVKIK